MQPNRSVLFVGDGGNAQILRGALSELNIDLHAHIKPAPLNMSVLSRHVRYFWLAAYAVWARKRYDAVFIWQQYIGLYYFLISLACPFYRRPCFVYYMIFQSKPASLLAWTKRFLFTRMIHSRAVRAAIFLSRCDALYPDIWEDKKLVLPTYTEKSHYIESRVTGGSLKIRSDYFSGGANNRDYPSLTRLAQMMESKRFSVACLRRDLYRMSPIPPNMTVTCDSYGEAFEELILSAKAVILPLEDPNVTSGQIVCLRALQSAKPVFLTRNNFVSEWMPDVDRSGFVVMYDDLEELRSLLSALTDSDLEEMGRQARMYYVSYLGEEAFYHGIADVIEARIKD